MNDPQFRKPVNSQSKATGVTLDCACVHCDYYQDEILLGASGTEGFYYFPALDSVRRKIIAINIYRFLKMEEFKSPEQENPELARIKSQNKFPYFDKEMFERSENENEMISTFPHLQSKFNRCPACGKSGLQFSLEDVLD